MRTKNLGFFKGTDESPEKVLKRSGKSEIELTRHRNKRYG